MRHDGAVGHRERSPEGGREWGATPRRSRPRGGVQATRDPPEKAQDSSACDAVTSGGRAMREVIMKIGTKEFIEMMATFERFSKGRYRLDREKRDLWSIRVFYQDPEANKAFLAFHEGVEYGKSISRT